MAPPAGSSVEVCHAYTCKIKTTFYFRPKDIQDISAEMRKVKNGDTPFQERRAIAYAIALIGWVRRRDPLSAGAAQQCRA